MTVHNPETAGDDPAFRIIVAKHLGEVRRKRGFTQVAVAKALKKNRSHLSNIESGRRGTTWQSLTDLAQYYDLPITQLIEDCRKMAPGNNYPNIPPNLINEYVRMLTEDERFVIDLFRALNDNEKRYVAKEILKLATDRIEKIGNT